MKKKTPRITRPAKKRRLTSNRNYKGRLGAGTLYAMVALLIILLGGSLMIGNVTPITTTSPANGQPVIISPANSEKQKDNLQLMTFPGATYTPTPAPTTPPQPGQSWQNQNGSGFQNGGGNGGGTGTGDGGNHAPQSGNGNNGGSGGSSGNAGGAGGGVAR